MKLLQNDTVLQQTR